MKKLIAITSVLGFVAALAVSPAVAADDYVSGCVPQKKDGSDKKNAKLKRVVVGTTSDCKSKQEPVTMPTKAVTDDLQTQITTNLTNLQSQITQNGNDIDQNAMDIMDVNDRVDAIATVIGGGTGTTKLSDMDATQYIGMFFSRTADSDLGVENRIPVPGTLRNFWVKQSGDTTGNANRLYTVYLRLAPASAVATALNCEIDAGENVCADNNNCVDVIGMNRRISVRADTDKGTGTVEKANAQWSAKFTPGDTCS